MLAVKTLTKISEIQTEQAKCICTTVPYVFVGSWNGRISIFDVQKSFKLVKLIKCRSAVRSLSALDDSTLLVGENEGWFEIVRISANIDEVSIISNRKLEAVGHVFTQ